MGGCLDQIRAFDLTVELTLSIILSRPTFSGYPKRISAKFSLPGSISRLCESMSSRSCGTACRRISSPWSSRSVEVLSSSSRSSADILAQSSTAGAETRQEGPGYLGNAICASCWQLWAVILGNRDREEDQEVQGGRFCDGREPADAPWLGEGLLPVRGIYGDVGPGRGEVGGQAVNFGNDPGVE